MVLRRARARARPFREVGEARSRPSAGRSAEDRASAPSPLPPRADPPPHSRSPQHLAQRGWSTRSQPRRTQRNRSGSSGPISEPAADQARSCAPGSGTATSGWLRPRASMARCEGSLDGCPAPPPQRFRAVRDTRRGPVACCGPRYGNLEALGGAPAAPCSTPVPEPRLREPHRRVQSEQAVAFVRPRSRARVGGRQSSRGDPRPAVSASEQGLDPARRKGR